MKTSELTGAALDWAVAKADDNLYPIGDVRLLDGRLVIIEPGDYERTDTWRRHNPTESWAQGGLIIEREIIEHGLLISSRLGKCEAVYPPLAPQWVTYYGNTPLIAAMRCYVASKLGDEVDVPEELA